MSCFPFSPQKTANALKEKLSSPKLFKKSKRVEDYFPPFMNGNLTSTSTWSLGSWDNDSAHGGDTTSMKMDDNESILASSHQNSNQDSLVSAPATVARSKVLACSTPKDVLSPNGAPPQPLFNNESPILASPPEQTLEAKKRLAKELYQKEQLRKLKLLIPPRRPGTENIKNSYWMQPIQPKEKPKTEEELKKEWKRQQDLEDFNDEILQRALSAILAIWQLFYLLNVIPTDNVLVHYGNMVFVGLYVFLFTELDVEVLAVPGSAFIMYLILAWLLNVTVNLGIFVFFLVFVTAILTTIDSGLLLRDIYM